MPDSYCFQCHYYNDNETISTEERIYWDEENKGSCDIMYIDYVFCPRLQKQVSPNFPVCPYYQPKNLN